MILRFLNTKIPVPPENGSANIELNLLNSKVGQEIRKINGVNKPLLSHNRSSTRSETVCPIDSDDVAAGDGALTTLMAEALSRIAKSSNRPPS